VVSGEPLPPGSFEPGKLPPGGGTKIPPVVSGEPLPPGSFEPGKLPPGGGTKIPPVVSGEPLPPGTFEPGKLPPGGGTKIPPVVTWEPYPTKLPTGGVTLTDAPKGPSKDGLGIPVKGPSGDDNCDPCAWLKLSYDQTGLTKWLDRYRLCLTWQRGA
jgi:hypothetical protein